MEHFRNAANHRMTFKKFLRKTYEILKKKVELLEGQDCEAVEEETENNQHSRRSRRVRFQFDGTTPQELNFGKEKSFNTPLKARKKQIERGDAAEGVLQRVHNCTGYPLEMIYPDDNQRATRGANGQERKKKKDLRIRCYVCTNKTKWVCVGCRLPFCMINKDTNNREKQLYFWQEKENINTNQMVTKVYGKSCYHEHHEAAILRALHGDSGTE